jgi:hypothetical protein
MEIASRIGFPPFHHTRGVADHDSAVACEPLARESRRCKTPLPVPEFPFAREQTFSENRGDMPPEEGIFLEPVMVLDENGFNIARAA